MKESAIRGIFNGSRGQYEVIYSQMKKTENDVIENEIKEAQEMLKSMLSDKLHALHIKCLDRLSQEHFIDIENYFTEGFKLGFQIAFECLESGN